MELEVGSPLAIVLGVLLLALGAGGATLTSRSLEDAGRASAVPLRLVPFGILVGAGAAFVRGWDLAAAVLVGAVVLPVIGTAARLLEVRRHRRRRALHSDLRG